MNSAPSLDTILHRVIRAAEAAGERLRAEFLLPGGPRGAGSKAPIDVELEEALREALQAAFPCDFLGEETGLTKGRVPGYRWLVDPHDGTSNYLRGARGSAVSVGLLRGSVPVLGVVHSPASPDRGRDTIAWAEGGGPVRRNGVAIQSALAGAQLRRGAFVWCTESAVRRPQFFAQHSAPARFIAMSSIAYRLARVAAGDGIAAISAHSVHEYDIAAGAALLRGAGGVLLDAGGHEIVFTGEENARVSGCIAGAPEAAARLARIAWSEYTEIQKLEPRVSTAFPKFADEARLARAQGCLAGQVAGDSLGSLVEFEDARAIAKKYPDGLRELADGGTWNTIAGQPTDDSEMALALARGILRTGAYDGEAALAGYRAWLQSKPFDIGGTTRAGLQGHANLASASNGSLMRVAPIGVWAAGEAGRAARTAREDSRLTHPNPVCVEACAAYAAAIAAGVATGDRKAMLEAALAHSVGEAHEAIARAAAGHLPRDFSKNPGWVQIALENAFYRLMHAPDLEQGVVATVAAGGDTDTNGAIAGALLGAAHGVGAIPPRWMLTVLACRPCAESDAPHPRPMEYWPDDVLEVAEALLIAGKPNGMAA
jgi:ADP-ribosyl-[dinitrogen reductase] hydrolase